VFQRAAAVVRNGHSPDYILLIAVVGLLLIGLMMVYSATFDRSYQEQGSSFSLALRHYEWTGIGVILLVVFMLTPYDVWQRLAVPIIVIAVVLLILVLLVGYEGLGAKRSFFNGSVQPGEPAKLAIVIYSAAWIVSKGLQIRDVMYGFLPFAVLVGFVAGLIALQPDYSAAGLVVVTALSMFFFAGADILQLAIGSSVVAVTGWAVVKQVSYVSDRLGQFVPPWEDPKLLGLHTQRSLVALGNGGLFGVGLGQGRQKLGYLFTQQTDSIFGVVGEELGFVGCMLVIGLFALLAYRGFKIASEADLYGSLLASGTTCMLIYQALLNIAVSAGLLPFIGAALPFLSYGGSAMTVSLASIGILLSVSRGNRIEKPSRFGPGLDGGWRNGGTRVSLFGRGPGSQHDGT